MSLWPEQSVTYWLSYRTGYRQAQVGPEETWGDMINELLLAHDIEHGTEEDEGT